MYIIFSRPVVCKLLANENERNALSKRLDIPQLLYLSANFTAQREDVNCISIIGKLEARIKSGEYLEIESVTSDFETSILDNSMKNAGVTIEEATDFDDEVDSNGDIDLGEIAAQYLSLEYY